MITFTGDPHFLPRYRLKDRILIRGIRGTDARPTVLAGFSSNGGRELERGGFDPTDPARRLVWQSTEVRLAHQSGRAVGFLARAVEWRYEFMGCACSSHGCRATDNAGQGSMDQHGH